jgi:hypothetical protein
MTESQKDTIAHVAKVQFNLSAVIANLAERSTVHNRSKFEEPELSGYESLQKSLQGVRYGTPDYRAALGAHEGVIMHHYAANTHHPEHWPNGIADMSLLDIIEMLADWKAAGERTKGGNLQTSIEFNIKRFGIGEQLADILINTAKELGWL